MLISPDRSQVILTPTKTGTKSLEAAFTKHGWTAHMPRHDRRLPIGIRGRARCSVIIRNPYDRLRSMYTFGLHTKHSTLLRWATFSDSKEASFEFFLHNWLAARRGRKNPDWTTTYSEYLQHAQGECRDGTMVTVFKIELGTGPILKMFKLPPEERHVNRSADKKVPKPPMYWTGKNVDMVAEVLEDDMELGSYEIPFN